MDLQAVTKFLSERQSYLWAGVLTATAFILLKKHGYAEGLENNVVTGVIAGGVFAGSLLVCTAVGQGIERLKKDHSKRKQKEADDAAALAVFEDLFEEHRQVLQFIATDIKKSRFKAGSERILFEMVDLKLLEVDGPNTSRTRYYKVRDAVWDKMIERTWRTKKKWPEDMPPPWDEDRRI